MNYDKGKRRSYSCRVCDRATGDYVSMLKHLQKAHKITEAIEPCNDEEPPLKRTRSERLSNQTPVSSLDAMSLQRLNMSTDAE